MGEEAAGVDAVRIAHARISAGQSDIALVGGSHNGERPDLLMLYEFAGMALKDDLKPVWQRNVGKGGFALGSIGAFLVIEASDHARARGATPLAKLSAVIADRASREPGASRAALGRMWDKIKDKVKSGAAVLSGATGAEPATADERAFLAEHGDLAVRATGTYLGHGLEPQFTMNLALAAIALGHGRLFPPDASGVEKPMDGGLTQVVVTGIGHWRGEGLALVEKIG
jgi:3-oxoacyl-[acyl-carrier-protein] synthase II